ncbi:hypothetical protein RG963_15685 [Methanosarcina sp. Z-7115]|uniref:SpoVT-AbrB domain-containing protein n=1 Tax=Methanosarcina baikalica TaxID=3073890 RepID=A0ABU2D5C4_9EURY|nr:hypothetical protein [Methanosarcina sp. Z-7115]MDR7667191.1 hypothetical protein [Methanosarcina sp. Z-7115]
MTSIQLSKVRIYSINIPVRIARSMHLRKGENAIIRKGKKENEFVVMIERE